MQRQEALTPGPSPAQRERDTLPPVGRGEGKARRRSAAIVRGAAREMRKQPTHSEDILWSALRNRALVGRKFRRQQQILESMGLRFLRLPAILVERDLPAALAMIERAFGAESSPAVRERVARRAG